MHKLNRRKFLQLGVIASMFPKSLLSGINILKKRNTDGIEKLLKDGARLMWIAAHPDDEALAGSILARSSLFYKLPCYMLVLRHGDGGECCRPEGCEPNLATVRGEEMKEVAKLYRATLQHEHYFNAPLPVSSFPARDKLAHMWKDKKDPAVLIAEAIRDFKPNLIITFSPVHGFTGHPEHQITSRFAGAGIRLAADESFNGKGKAAHKVDNFYYALNRYWPFLITGGADPGPVTETWSTLLPATDGMTCRDIMARFSRAHRSQNRDMGTVRRLKMMISKTYLRKSDPFKEIYDPYEKA